MASVKTSVPVTEASSSVPVADDISREGTSVIYGCDDQADDLRFRVSLVISNSNSERNLSH